jgi:pteridine reductase
LISKAGLESLTKAMARAMAPQVTVNGIALGAILPPIDGASSDKIIQSVPMKRWAELDEVTKTVLFLLEGPEYITGEIIHLDGGRHLV